MLMFYLYMGIFIHIRPVQYAAKTLWADCGWLRAAYRRATSSPPPHVVSIGEID